MCAFCHGRWYVPTHRHQQILVPIVIVTACCGPWRATQHFSCEPVEVDDNSLGRRGRGSVASVCGKGWITRAEHESNGGAHFLKIESALLECTSFANCGELRRIHMQRAASTVTRVVALSLDQGTTCCVLSRHRHGHRHRSPLMPLVAALAGGRAAA